VASISDLLARAESRETINELLDLLCKLVSIPTVNPPGENYEEFCKQVRDLLHAWGITCEIIKVPDDYVARYLLEYKSNPRYILVASIGSGRPTLHINGHYDVVPPGSGWTITEPFKPRIVNERVYGRGSVDMKGGIAVSLILLKLLTKIESNIRGRVEVVLVPDEEIGGETGTGYLVNELKVRPDYVIVAEPSSSRRVLIGNKGAIWLLVESRVSRYDYDIEGGNKATITFGGDVKSAGKVNVVPGYFAFSIDRRVIPEEDLEQAERELIDFIKSKAEELNIAVNIRVLQKSPPAVVSPDCELVKKLDEAALEVLGTTLRKVVCTGGLDTRYYQLAGIQAVTYGPGDASCAHMADEFIEVSELRDVLKVYIKLCEKLNIVET